MAEVARRMMATKAFLLVTILLCAFISHGCGVVDVRQDVERIEIASAVFLTLPRAEDLTESFNATQVIDVVYDERSYSFQVQFELRPGRITIAAVNLWGGTLFSVTYDGIALRAQSLIDTEGVNAEYLLADVLLTFWDSEWVSARLQGAVLKVSQIDGSRTISRRGEPVIEISYETTDPWVGRTRFTHVERGYFLDIRTVEISSS